MKITFVSLLLLLGSFALSATEVDPEIRQRCSKSVSAEFREHPDFVDVLRDLSSVYSAQRNFVTYAQKFLPGKNNAQSVNRQFLSAHENLTKLYAELLANPNYQFSLDDIPEAAPLSVRKLAQQALQSTDEATRILLLEQGVKQWLDSLKVMSVNFKWSWMPQIEFDKIHETCSDIDLWWTLPEAQRKERCRVVALIASVEEALRYCDDLAQFSLPESEASDDAQADEAVDAVDVLEDIEDGDAGIEGEPVTVEPPRLNHRDMVIRFALCDMKERMLRVCMEELMPPVVKSGATQDEFPKASVDNQLDEALVSVFVQGLRKTLLSKYVYSSELEMTEADHKRFFESCMDQSLQHLGRAYRLQLHFVRELLKSPRLADADTDRLFNQYNRVVQKTYRDDVNLLVRCGTWFGKEGLPEGGRKPQHMPPHIWKMMNRCGSNQHVLISHYIANSETLDLHRQAMRNAVVHYVTAKGELDEYESGAYVLRCMEEAECARRLYELTLKNLYMAPDPYYSGSGLPAELARFVEVLMFNHERFYQFFLYLDDDTD